MHQHGPTDSDPAARPRKHKSEQDPASTEIVEVAPNVLRMQLPIWMPGLGHVNMYGLVDRNGIAVVDPGLPGPQSWKALQQRLGAAGFRVKDIHTVIVTHSHPDHFGGAGRIAKEGKARLVTHAAFKTWFVKGPSEQRALSEGEARRLEHEAAQLAQMSDVLPEEIPTIADDPDLVHDDTHETETTANPWASPTPWGATHSGPRLRRKLMVRAMKLLFPNPHPTHRMHHGDRIMLGEREWIGLHTPGHTVDHLCLFEPDSGLLLSGDHVLPSITPHVSGVRSADSLRSYLATLDLVGQLDGVTQGLPAHGSLFDDVPGRVEAIKEHHHERMEMLRAASQARGAATVADLSHEVFPERHWGIMAESETFAHLEHLVHAGEAERFEQNGLLYYRVADAQG